MGLTIAIVLIIAIHFGGTLIYNVSVPAPPMPEAAHPNAKVCVWHIKDLAPVRQPTKKGPDNNKLKALMFQDTGS